MREMKAMKNRLERHTAQFNEVRNKQRKEQGSELEIPTNETTSKIGISLQKVKELSDLAIKA